MGKIPQNENGDLIFFYFYFFLFLFLFIYLFIYLFYFFLGYSFNMLTPNLSDKVVLDFIFQSLSKDMLHDRVLTNSSKGLPCPHFSHGNGIFPILSNIDFVG